MGDEPLVKKEKESSACNPWVTGGSIGGRSCVLQFRCGALSKAPVAPPGDVLHMTYKTYQAETKLLAAVLSAHGLREVGTSFSYCTSSAQFKPRSPLTFMLDYSSISSNVKL